MEQFKKKSMAYFIDQGVKGLPKEYILDAIFDEKMQEMWHPQVGDIIVGSTGNVFVISGKQSFHEDIGGDVYFFGGTMAAMNGCIMDTPTCYTMNHDGLFMHSRKKFPGHGSWHEFRFVPYPHETNRMSEKFKAKAAEYMEQKQQET